MSQPNPEDEYYEKQRVTQRQASAAAIAARSIRISYSNVERKHVFRTRLRQPDPFGYLCKRRSLTRLISPDGVAVRQLVAFAIVVIVALEGFAKLVGQFRVDDEPQNFNCKR